MYELRGLVNLGRRFNFGRPEVLFVHRRRPDLPVAAVLDPAFVELEGNAVYDKAAAVKGADFDTSQIELTEWKAAKLDNDAALVTYLITSKDSKMDSERHTTIWANRNGKWVALLHVGTPVAKPAPKSEMTPGMKM